MCPSDLKGCVHEQDHPGALYFYSFIYLFCEYTKILEVNLFANANI